MSLDPMLYTAQISRSPNHVIISRISGLKGGCDPKTSTSPLVFCRSLSQILYPIEKSSPEIQGQDSLQIKTIIKKVFQQKNRESEHKQISPNKLQRCLNFIPKQLKLVHCKTSLSIYNITQKIIKYSLKSSVSPFQEHTHDII